MSFMKEYLIDCQETLVNQTAKASGFSEDLIWDVIEAVADSPTSVGAMEDTEEICNIMMKGEKGVRAEYEERTGNIIKGNTILDLYEDIKFDSKNDMLCDIIYSIRELRRS